MTMNDLGLSSTTICVFSLTNRAVKESAYEYMVTPMPPFHIGFYLEIASPRVYFSIKVPEPGSRRKVFIS
jgi:hypothetical protein